MMKVIGLLMLGYARCLKDDHAMQEYQSSRHMILDAALLCHACAMVWIFTRCKGSWVMLI